MFVINSEDNSIYATRGDVVFFGVKAVDAETKYPFTFEPGDILRMKIYGKKNAENVVMQKDFAVSQTCEVVQIFLEEEDTKFGEVISKPTDYWYEVELNPETCPQTIVGYNEDGATLFKLFPEGADTEINNSDIKPEDIPIVDAELDVNSARPIQNQAVARAIIAMEGRCEVGVVHANGEKVDRSFNKILQWCLSGVPVMVMTQGEPPAFAVSWDENKIDFTAGSYMKVADDFGLIRFRFVKYRLFANGAIHDNSEMYDLQYTDRYF